MAKEKLATKVGRKDVVTIQRAAQAIREHAYRIRTVLEPGLDTELVVPELVAQVTDANDAVNRLLNDVGTVIAMVDALPVMENLE
jgi:hypothetical protein